jgi:hypothetical protein
MGTFSPPNQRTRLGTRRLRELAGLLAQRELEVPIGAVHPLERVAETLSLVTRRRARGAVVLHA